MHKTEAEIKTILKAMQDAGSIAGYVYDHFTQDDPIPTPFAVYRRVAVPSFKADDKVYTREDSEDVEFYADDPDTMDAIMESFESRADAAGLVYDKTADTVYIEDEDFYESLYEF